MESGSKSKRPLGPYKPTLILHGGAGNITRSNLPPALYAKYHASLLSYVTSTRTMLFNGGTAVDGVCHAVTSMEDDPLFNCGHGSVFTTKGEIEMEASLAVTSIHDGTDHEIDYEGRIKRSAAVSMIKRTRHPILLAREVLGMADEDGGMGGTSTMHGHLSGEDVEQWGWNRGLERKDKKWFWTKKRWDQHRRDLEKHPPHFHEAQPYPVHEDELEDLEDDLDLPSQGTVGAVCMDSWGVIAVATSTGGLTNKLPGRIGDTPTIGAGFWAESWDAKFGLNQTWHSTPATSLSEKLVSAAKSELNFWLSDCFAPRQYDELRAPSLSEHSLSQGGGNIVEKQPAATQCPRMTSRSRSEHRLAVAMSGTGNGDSFMRINACRTAAAFCRGYPTTPPSHPLAVAVQVVAGPGGLLQKSAGDRWGKTGQGEGGIIGIELISGTGSLEGKTIFDFNCGGLWRAYFEKDDDGNEKPVVMVFRNEY